MLTERQQQIVTGSLLGDGTIWTNFVDPLMKWQVGQSKRDWHNENKKNYMCWYAKEFIDLGVSIRSMNIKATGVAAKKCKEASFDRYVFYTRCNEFWNDVGAKWYVQLTDHPRFKRRKIVPTDIKLTPLALCIWHMDDGSNNQTDANIELNTQSFNVDEVDFLIERLKQDLGIDSHKKTGGKERQYKIYVGRDSYFEFIEMIKPHVEWDCFKYKIDTSGYNKQPHRGETHSGSIITEEKVREIFKLRDEGMLQKDIKKQVGVSNISAILSGEQWAHLGLSRPKLKKARLTEETKKQIFELESKGESQNHIAQTLNINQSTVSRVLKSPVERFKSQSLEEFKEDLLFLGIISKSEKLTKKYKRE